MTLNRFGWFGRLWCRIAYGHLKLKVITHTGDREVWVCARCLQRETLFNIDGNSKWLK